MSLVERAETWMDAGTAAFSERVDVGVAERVEHGALGCGIRSDVTLGEGARAHSSPPVRAR